MFSDAGWRGRGRSLGTKMFIWRGGYPDIAKSHRREGRPISLTCGTLLLALAVGVHEAQAVTVISTAQQLQDIQSNLAGNYVLGADVDASVTATWNGGAGFLPIGNSSKPFTGTLNGDGHVIINLFIASAATNVGLFGVIGAKATLKSLWTDRRICYRNKHPLQPRWCAGGDERRNSDELPGDDERQWPSRPG